MDEDEADDETRTERRSSSSSAVATSSSSRAPFRPAGWVPHGGVAAARRRCSTGAGETAVCFDADEANGGGLGAADQSAQRRPPARPRCIGRARETTLNASDVSSLGELRRRREHARVAADNAKLHDRLRAVLTRNDRNLLERASWGQPTPSTVAHVADESVRKRVAARMRREFDDGLRPGAVFRGSGDAGDGARGGTRRAVMEDSTARRDTAGGGGSRPRVSAGGVPKTLGLALCTACGARAYAGPTRTGARGGGRRTTLTPCGSCRDAWYCSQSCAREDWSGHRKTCAGVRHGY